MSQVQTGEHIWDVVIIGGGITGLSAAAALADSGLEILLLEQDILANGTTGGNSSQMMSLVDLDPKRAFDKYELDTAQLMTKSLVEAQKFVESTCLKYDITHKAEFKYLPAYLFANTEDQAQHLLDVMDIGTQCGLDITHHQGKMHKLPYTSYLRIENQAHLNASGYVKALADKLKGLNKLTTYEHTLVNRIDESNDLCILETEYGKIFANKIIEATHTPVSFNPAQTEIFPHVSYCILADSPLAAKLDGIMLDTDENYMYMTPTKYEGKDALIVGGYDTKVGGETEVDSIEMLTQWAMKYTGATKVHSSWANIYFESADGLPFIGRSALGSETYIACGYGGDGLSFGTVAGLLIADLIQDRENPYAEMYNSRRLNIFAGGLNILKGNIEAIRTLIGDRIAGLKEVDVANLPINTGKVGLIGGKKIAAYKDERGILHTMSPVCPHMGGIVHWNDAAKTWDCPIHGARFCPKGEMKAAPAMSSLERKSVSLL